MHGPDTTISMKPEIDRTGLETPPATLAEPLLSDNARTVLAKRYLKKGPDLEPNESPTEMFWRV
ncbi:MAG: hypothetical protein JJE01_13210, partial [Gemmatimonadetes bacterium]|nr:hypothetical protein [Gemmatimonadota bacterium]